MNKKICTAVLAGTSLMVSAGLANAASSSTTMDITALVGTACTVSASPITFNVIDPTAPVDTVSQGYITVTCNPGVPFDIALDAGKNPSGGTRFVANGLGDFGAYFFDYAGLQPWGDGGITLPDPVVSAIASGGADVFVANGIFFSSQFIPDGVYTDVVTVTVIY